MINFEKEWFEFLKAHPGDDPDEAVGAFGEVIWKKALESDQKYTEGFAEGMKQGREDRREGQESKSLRQHRARLAIEEARLLAPVLSRRSSSK